METLRAFSIGSLNSNPLDIVKSRNGAPLFFSARNNSISKASSFTISHRNTHIKSKLFTATSPTISTEHLHPPEVELEPDLSRDKFDWYSNWYPVMPVCDLDKRKPHAKKILGIDVVVWWDRNEGAWKVFDDMCPHRLAPLSEGRIDQWGRLQCVYHGWCFDGAGDCKLIPQAPSYGPPVHTSKRACVAAYPTTVHHDMVWFWPNTDPKYKDVLKDKKPPVIPELDDPSFSRSIGNRDINYGYELLIENLMDPAHVPYSHYGIMRIPKRKNSVKVDREGGRPLNLTIKKLDVNGFTADQEWGEGKFVAPCIFYAGPKPAVNDADQKVSRKQPTFLLIFICVPVSPGKSRLIWTFPRNVGVWIEKVVPRWMFHVGQNLILDSDLYLLHVEEHKIKDVGEANWQKACYMPTKSDALVVNFRRWMNKYAGGQVDWKGKYSGLLPPTPPKEQLLDRYWSHVENCSSCKVAYKGLNVLEVVLQVLSFASLGIVAATKQSLMMPAATRTTILLVSILCFALSRWLSHFIYKTFKFHDYSHAFR